MTRIHEAAAVGFDAGAEAYERGRPEYPASAIAMLVEALGLGPGRTAVDLAAGTGKMTRLLLRSGALLLGVEPVAGMRAAFRRVLPEVPLVAGVAESIPLADDVADAVVVAQAFHWFDGDAALAEIHRVLRPGGWLGLVWNVRDDAASAVSATLTALMAPFRPHIPDYRTGAWRPAFERTEGFGDLRFAAFPYEQRLTREQALDRVLSVSAIAALPADRQAGIRARVLDLLGDRDELVLPYRTEVHWAEAV